MNLPKDSAIVFNNVSKTYRMYESPWRMMLDTLGLKKQTNAQEFYALKNISLDIKQGERLGLVGRNGAGKTTLLKLITGNFIPSSGKLLVNGNIQALINTGLGFHPEFSGLENIKASLLYNGLSKKDYNNAIEDIIDFVELGDFLNQPLKTYSLGMQSRLYFAVATAVKPEILIIDEVLGAGDAYFSAKSADRMKNLTNQGCTLILVSHSTQQILQFCENAVWIECGEKIKEGKALEVVKSYEEFSKKLELEAKAQAEAQQRSAKKSTQSIIHSKWLREKLLKEVLNVHANDQETLPSAERITGNISQGGISRWQATEKGLQITDVRVLDENNNLCYLAQTGQKLTIEISFEASQANTYDCHFAILILNKEGRPISRHRSELFSLDLVPGNHYKATLIFDNLLLGTGDYIFSPSIFKDFGSTYGNQPKYYDLLSRSFEFKVDNFNDDPSLIKHPAKWDVNVSTALAEI